MRLLFGLFLLLLAMPAQADEVRPLYVESREGAGNSYVVKWRLPANFPAQLSPAIELPADCVAQGEARAWAGPLGAWQERAWLCREPMAGRPLDLAYPRGNPNLATILKVVDRQGGITTAMFLPSSARLDYPDSGSGKGGSVFFDYLVLGVEHIWIGLDHLLFVACLIWIAGTPVRVLQTITGFTAAHSLTLVLSALDLVAVPVASTEVVIALSIVLLAVELARGRRDTLTWRRPVVVSILFGLLHGFGFAAALREVGLPEEGFARALLAFNVGIELGQLAFAGLLIALTALVVRIVPSRLSGGTGALAEQAMGMTPLPPAVRLLIAYPVGIVATCWMLQRAI